VNLVNVSPTRIRLHDRVDSQLCTDVNADMNKQVSWLALCLGVATAWTQSVDGTHGLTHCTTYPDGADYRYLSRSISR
jgi:hypothetical protein